ncbi:hypothetical protein GCM10009119_21480 [Algoriphagus jejuensis]|uniref:Heme-binding HmuY-like protein n=1 Tax=Algoriphagus jejuensis TaxID=419934 RepID=A0ABP3YEH1_9BACT
MRNRFTALSGAFALFFLTCCTNDDPEPMDPIVTGKTLTAAMGANMANQVYVDLSSGTLTSVAVNSWELAFEKSGNGLKTNSAKKVGVAFPATGDFDSVTSKEGLVFAYDSEDGELSETALAKWALNTPYVLDLGIDANGNVLGFRKFMITAKTGTSVSLRVAELDGSNATNLELSMGTENFTYVSLIDKKSVSVEPANWDLVLTAVSLRTGAPCGALGGGAKPGVNCDVYRLSTTALINSYAGVRAATDDPFASLSASDDPASERNQKNIEASNFGLLKIADYTALGPSAFGDAIGRGWLQILAPHSSGIYKVYDFMTYLVKDEEGHYYKLRFLAFKGGDNAENGYPTFEYELMNE